MKIAFITAMPEEFRAVTGCLDGHSTFRIGPFKVCRGTASGHDIAVIESGMGFANATMATKKLIGEVAPDLIISAGYCGGIAPILNVGDVVVATRVVIVSGGSVEEVPVELATAGYSFVANKSTSDHRVFGGMYVNTPTVMEKSRISAMLPIDASHPVVEMESAAIALIATENKVPFIGIRSVSDPAGEELGFSLDEFCDNQMRIRISRVLLTIIRKPGIIPQLVRLARNSRIAGTNLTRVVEKFLDFV